MRSLLQVLLHGLCCVAGFWFVAPQPHDQRSAEAATNQVKSRKMTTWQPAPPPVPPVSDSAARLASLTPENWPEAIQAISLLRVDEMPTMLRSLLRNPFPEVKRRLLRFLFERWAMLDRAGALAAMHGLSSPEHKERVLHEILSNWTKTHADAAWQYVTAMEEDSVLQEVGIESLLALKAGDDLEYFTAWAAQLDDVFLREKALDQISAVLINKDQEGALAAALTIEPERLRDLLLSRLRYRDGVDHAAGLEIVSQLPSQAQRSRLSADWIGAFADQKPQEAFHWLLQHADRPELQKSADELGGILAVKTKNVEDLRIKALQLPSGPLRDAFAARAADEWAASGRPIPEAEALLALCGPCLERDSAQHTIDSNRQSP